MDEGVDPTQMCQALMDKMARSELLQTVANPDILVLFEDWLEELEEELIAYTKEKGTWEINDISRDLGLSVSGARFLIAKLRREGKLLEE